MVNFGNVDEADDDNGNVNGQEDASAQQTESPTPNPSTPQSGVSTGQSAVVEQQKILQQQLVLLLHAKNCLMHRHKAKKKEVQKWHCTRLHCQTMRNVLKHLTKCKDKDDCPVPHCSSSRLIIAHWKNCKRTDCPLCSPIKQTYKRKHVTTPTNKPNNIKQIINHQQLLLRHRQKYSPSLLASLITNTYESFSRKQLCDENYSDNLQSPGSRPITAIPVHKKKEWQHSVTSDLRLDFIYKILESTFPKRCPQESFYARLHSIIEYVQKVEAYNFKLANSIREYHFLLAAKICYILKKKSQKGVEQQQLAREQQQRQRRLPSSRSSQL